MVVFRNVRKQCQYSDINNYWTDEKRNVKEEKWAIVFAYQLGSTSIAGQDARNGSSLRPANVDDAPRGCINGSMNKTLQRMFDLWEIFISLTKKSCKVGCLRREWFDRYVRYWEDKFSSVEIEIRRWRWRRSRRVSARKRQYFFFFFFLLFV